MNLALRSTRRSAQLPDFPWDTLAAAKARAQAHPDGIVDLSIGTPVDATPDIARQHAAYDDPEPDDVWPEASLRAGWAVPNLGRVISGHGGILGLSRPELDRTSGGSR